MELATAIKMLNRAGHPNTPDAEALTAVRKAFSSLGKGFDSLSSLTKVVHTPPTYLTSPQVREENERLRAEVAALREQLEKGSAGGASAPSPAPQPPPAPAKPKEPPVKHRQDAVRFERFAEKMNELWVAAGRTGNGAIARFCAHAKIGTDTVKGTWATAGVVPLEFYDMLFTAPFASDDKTPTQLSDAEMERIREIHASGEPYAAVARISGEEFGCVITENTVRVVITGHRRVPEPSFQRTNWKQHPEVVKFIKSVVVNEGINNDKTIADMVFEKFGLRVTHSSITGLRHRAKIGNRGNVSGDYGAE
jgi:hypothetical protein